ncbi:MAG TPA: hypothetical protein VMU94_01750 [Streptosporangiaceae bacterium]|nr:hypothetical protein [Streptosporangiaceae bacterium]
MSSAILYLAIIGIWAVFLVPAWIRRPHATAAGSADETLEHADGELAVEYVTDTENDVEVSVEADIHVEVSHHEHEYQEYRHEVPSHAGYALDAESDEHAEAQEAVQRPSQSREQMLRARRRMLTILAGMTAVTVGFTFLGLVQWWICVPPAGMLVLYVLLLREIAMVEAEQARKRAAWEAGEARRRASEAQAEAEREAYEASPADAGAQIIDISGRVSDQLYDQYADAAVRAVGD